VYPSMLSSSGDLFADVSQLQDRLQELFGNQTQGSSIRAVARAGAFPALNVGTWADALEIYAFAPGVMASSIDVSVEKGLLTISGERPDAHKQGPKAVAVYARERFTGPFRRVVALPEDVDTTRVAATYTNGVLKIVIPKSESSKPRHIQVSGTN
jgi:HSP20 family protein